MPLGILGAMPEEVGLLKADLQGGRTTSIGGRDYHAGQLYGRDVVLAFSGWGKVAAASTVTTLIDRFQASPVIFSGVAGAAAPELNIGDVVLGYEFVQHDMDARPIFQQFEIPLAGLSRFPADRHLLESLARAASAYVTKDLASDLDPETRAGFTISAPKVVSGLIASGDQFIGDAEILQAIRRALPGLQCVEMEGAAVAQVCHGFGVPLGVVRVISDRADHTAGIDFTKFIASVASRYSRGILRRFLQAMTAAAACLLLLAAPPARAEESCDPAQPDCSCGRMPVCVISGADIGLYSSAWFSDPNTSWQGFGEGTDQLNSAVMAEIAVLNALMQVVPCIEPILTDGYSTGISLAFQDAEEMGLDKQLQAAKAAGDAARIAEIERQIDELLTKYDAGDFPWKDSELAQVHLNRRALSCTMARVSLSGRREGGEVVLVADPDSMPGYLEDPDFEARGASFAEAAPKIAEQAAKPLNELFATLFGSCREAVTHCVTTNFDLSNQQHECTTTTSCPDGRTFDTQTVAGPGIGMGRTQKWVPGCCGVMDALRNSTQPEDEDQRALANEIWCDGTWDLRAGDMDCDGQANKTDPTPYAPGDEP